MAKKTAKTNAIRMIEQQKIPHEVLEYTIDDSAVDGISVAQKINQEIEMVFKTLIATNGKGQFYVFVIPVAKELDLKAAAKIAGEKKVELIAVKELLGLTGYVRGGCSPVGMKKLFPTFIDQSAEELDFMIVSAGKIGMQMKLSPAHLLKVVNAKYGELTV
ncbi:Cys-tRNA(Pro) deacylase [Metasolibacillus sp. FSL H7-0170]|uniref:Cys-tRNA(Pro) deacylase n=1 Tax=Metasolibacillus sp. FSL H7-0170 TaxID=2921431 RepID=UPI0007967C7F|nr:aminoacyl-tRNA deacylase [[Bacillus] sp. KCTC 13219]